MPLKYKVITGISIVICIVAIILYMLVARPMLEVMNGYAAKKACTSYYVSKKSIEGIQTTDLHFSPLSLAQISIDEPHNAVYADLYGLQARKAVYRGDLGCILLDGEDDYNIAYTRKDKLQDFIPYDPVDSIDIVYDSKKLQNAMKYAFQSEYTTEGIAVIYKDSIIHEQYGNYVNADTPLLGWSMTKSITSSIVGKLVKEGVLALDQTQLFPQWKDERSAISLNDMLHMSSGLYWEEEYSKPTDATEMLYGEDDVVSLVVDKKLEFTPGTEWEYSSGTSNLLMALIANQFDSKEAFYDYVFDFFDQCGMYATFIEPDESGNLIGSSYGYATVRDWARFGQLYLHQGYINGQQLLDTSWIRYSRMPVSDKVGWYGGHFWMNVEQCHYQSLPDDLYYASGFRGQYIFIIPSRKLIIVRLGNSDSFDEEKFVNLILSALAD